MDSSGGISEFRNVAIPRHTHAARRMRRSTAGFGDYYWRLRLPYCHVSETRNFVGGARLIFLANERVVFGNISPRPSLPPLASHDLPFLGRSEARASYRTNRLPTSCDWTTQRSSTRHASLQPVRREGGIAQRRASTSIVVSPAPSRHRGHPTTGRTGLLEQPLDKSQGRHGGRWCEFPARQHRAQRWAWPGRCSRPSSLRFRTVFSGRRCPSWRRGSSRTRPVRSL